MSKINVISYHFSFLFKALIILYPLSVISMWLGLITFPQGYFSFGRLPVNVDLHSLRLTVRILACLVEMIPTLIVMMGFYYLIQLFKLYSQNSIFGMENVILIRKTAYTFIGQVIASFVTQPILSLVLTMDAPVGGHTIAIGLGSDEVSNLVIGGIVVLISRIMEEGRKLEEEKTLTI